MSPQILHEKESYQLRVASSLRIKPLGSTVYQVYNTMFNVVEAKYTSLPGAWDDFCITCAEMEAIGDDINGVVAVKAKQLSYMNLVGDND